ncbi:hypothetical protein MHY_16220 [Megamonas hypermegale ART12/1]|jgi:hypothetical protein|nr:hypothetical protein MHY_16220 [Megamonas hypermegale ART12/1]
MIFIRYNKYVVVKTIGQEQPEFKLVEIVGNEFDEARSQLL